VATDKFKKELDFNFT